MVESASQVSLLANGLRKDPPSEKLFASVGVDFLKYFHFFGGKFVNSKKYVN